MLTFRVYAGDEVHEHHVMYDSACEEYAFLVTKSIASKDRRYRDGAVTMVAVHSDGEEEILYEHIVKGQQ